MSDAIKLSVTGDTQALVEAVNKGAVAVDDLQDVLKDAGKQGDRSGDQIEKSMRNAQGDTKDLKTEIKQATDAFDKAGRAGRDLGTNVKYGTDDAKKGISEIGDEAASTAKESAASFDGSAASIGDAFQEVAANAFAGFGPAGLIAGVAAAAGIGVVFSAIEQGSADTEAFKAKVAELADEFIKTGDTGKASLDFVVGKLQEMASATEDGADTLKELRGLTEKTGGSFEDLAQAVAGNTDELTGLLKAGEKHKRQLEDEAEALDMTTAAGNKRYGQVEKQIDAQDRINGKLRDSVNAAKDAAQAEADYAASGGPALEAKAAVIDTINTAYDDAAGASEDYVNKESGLLDVGAYVAAMEAKQQALANYQNDLETSGLTPQAKSFLNSQGADAAATFLAGYKSATPEQKAALARIWNEAGSTSSAAFSASLRSAMPSSIPGPSVVLQTPDTGAITRTLQERLSRSPLRVEAAVFTRNGTQVY